ncbi:MAG: C39 family peptidase [Planctomycetes bacterium]|nr:C39 family peptidase [Planctomycetota bacterium]
MAIKTKILLVLLTVMILGGLTATLPPVRQRLVYRFDQVKTRLRYTLFPPEKAVFVPQPTLATSLAKGEITPTPAPSATITPAPTLLPSKETPTPTLTATPLPDAVALKGGRYIDQHGLWNYCAPASLAMELSYWGWSGTREDVGHFVKPVDEDKNVMPYELADYVTSQTKLSAVIRAGGTLDLLKRLTANGYVVLIEKGTYIQETTTGKLSWMGHYDVVSGYSDADQEIIVQDSYFKPDLRIKYETILQEWRGFNNVFLVVYPPEKEQDLMSVLGDYADEANSYRIAYAKASQETNSLSGIEAFFAWFNRGSSQVNLQDYAGAAASYDQAFALYPSLPEDRRPYRIMWYQTGPYFAYYYMTRYQDVINLATQTVDYVEKPFLEESFYWRGRARGATGDAQGDIADQRIALKYHPGFKPSLDELARLGVVN